MITPKSFKPYQDQDYGCRQLFFPSDKGQKKVLINIENGNKAAIHHIIKQLNSSFIICQPKREQHLTNLGSSISFRCVRLFKLIASLSLPAFNELSEAFSPTILC
jgi:hypothetical protein